MTRKLLVLIPAVLALLLVVVMAAAAQQPLVAPQAEQQDASQGNRHADYTYKTEIVVDSGTDPDNSKSYTCQTAPDGKCTLRRAIVESRLVAAADRPVLISFDIPKKAAEGYVSDLGIWKIEPKATSDPYVFRRLKGQVIIDGDTQPGGRQDGPKIFIVGPGTGQEDGLIVGDTALDDEIKIFGLAFQNFGTHMYVNSDDNVIADNWFGLNEQGTAPYLRDDEPEDGSGNTGISLNGKPTGNIIRDNVFLGLDGVAAAIRGEDNVFRRNLVGTKADGSVDKKFNPQLLCTTADWLGGGGVSVDNENNLIENNTFAGLRQEIFELTRQPDAIRVAGDKHIIKNNKIGVDGTGAEVGVCGRGILLLGANEPEYVQLLDNVIVNVELSAISINGALVDANTMQANIIKKKTTWPEIEGNPVPEAAIQFGKTVPDDLKYFKPARVTTVNGTTVRGTSGAGSPCPNCTVELFLDDTDAITEALQFLGRTVADGKGKWKATIPFELPVGHGIRTTSTSAQYNTIKGMDAGTTTKLSELQAVAWYKAFLPIVKRP